MQDLSPTWPPAYSLRLSRKAKYPHLKMIPNKGLEVVIPQRLQKRVCVTTLLNEKKTWIEKHLAQVEIIPPQYIETLQLRAINQCWDVEYQATQSRRIQSIIRPGTTNPELVLYGRVQEIELTHKWLKDWLKSIAQEHLLPWLQALSILYDLPYRKATIGAQQTLWGSCNHQKNISLNYKLLFLPRELAKHVLLHELCHTKHLNHSKRFWQLLQQLDPQTAMHDAGIRAADQFVPFGL